MAANTYGGGRHPTALIGNAPESRDWKPGDDAWLPAVHDTARVEAFVTVDSGIKHPTHVGARSWLFKHSHVGHDAWIGSDVEISTGAIVGGHAEVHDGARVGLGAVVLPYRKVGRGATVGAGAVVTKDVPAGETWAGNPARKLEKRDPRPYTKRAACDGSISCSARVHIHGCFAE